ncbi:SCO family protein [Hymenobacter guriensis]|uniref:SCO family protein n=1 Tax=Hymenobacter guriensis TaxID=2793065 RepID=A0ABS0L1E7_9BACT|nr:SCO family protein [Hymenobacter guriensis]MBG8553893.1 SCO family protein [Hymenobacter guriensis]
MTRFFIRQALRSSALAWSAGLLLASCSLDSATDKAATLPYIGEREVKPRADGGPADTVFAVVPTFRLTNQQGQPVTKATFAGKVYVTDFFFATCPSICPKMQSELLRVYERYKGNPRVAFLSHTIDPDHDSILVLRDYAERLGVKDASQWHFATAARDTVFGLAHAYFTAAQPDKEAPGGVAHNGTFALVDSKGHVRGLYDGMVKAEVDRLIRELPVLLKEEEQTAATAAN